MNILLTESSGYKAVCAAAFVRRHYPSVRIVTCDQSPITRWVRTRHSDRHYVVPKASRHAEQYLAALESICRREAVNLTIPTHSSEMPVLLKHRKRFGETLGYWGDFETFAVLNDKRRVRDVAAGLGLKVPRAYDSVAAANLPFVVKPRVSSGARGVRFAFSERDRASLLAQRHTRDEAVVEEYVDGAGAGLSAFCRSGELLVAYAHRRLAEFPASGGSSVYRETLEHEGIRRAATTLLKAVGWSGFCMVEFRLLSSGEACLIEVNPRIWGSLNQGLMNGANYFEPLLGPPERRSPRPAGEIRTYHSPLLYLSLLQYLRRWRPGPLLRFLRLWPTNRADISVFRDPLGWLGFLTRL